MTLEGPRITNEDRGFTINKTLAWAMAASIAGCVFWFGTITAESDGRITVLQERQVEDRELIRENQLQINALRATPVVTYTLAFGTASELDVTKDRFVISANAANAESSNGVTITLVQARQTS